MELIAHVKLGRLRIFSEPYDACRRSTDPKYINPERYVNSQRMTRKSRNLPKMFS